jgi:hypothetical protein
LPRKSREEKLQEYIDEAQSEIAYCLNCQSRDSGEWVWVFGIQYEMGDFLGGHLGILEDYWEEVADSLVCPNCGTELNMGYDVGLPTPEEKAVKEKWNDWHNRYDWKFEEFFAHLEKYPYLGMQHALGKEIFDKISSLPVCSIEGELWYRARRLQDGKLKVTSEMYPPDPDKVEISEGRFNHFGQRVFYLAESAEGAIKETLDDDEKVGWIQRFVVSSKKLLDLSEQLEEQSGELDLLAFGLIHAGVLEKMTARSKGWKPEYFVPRYIADCARLRSIRGIKFKSTRHFQANLVLFEWSDESIVSIETPYLLSLNKLIEDEDPFIHLRGDICINFFMGTESIKIDIPEDMLDGTEDSSTYNIFEAAVYLNKINKNGFICNKTITANVLLEKIALMFLESHDIPEAYKQLSSDNKDKLWKLLSRRYLMKKFD